MVELRLEAEPVSWLNSLSQIGLASALTLGLALAAPTVEAQKQGKVYRIGRLSVSDAETTSSEAFRRGLRELGWVVDQNVVVEQRNAGGDLKRLAPVAAELVRMNVDVIVAAGSDSVEAAFQATKSIPIVMAVGTDPERRGWIKSLARPGGNVTGLIAFLPQMGSKRIELVKDLLPRARRVGVTTDSSPNMHSEFEHIEAAGRSLGLEIQYVRVMSSETSTPPSGSSGRLRPMLSTSRRAPASSTGYGVGSRPLESLRAFPSSGRSLTMPNRGFSSRTGPASWAGTTEARTLSTRSSRARNPAISPSSSRRNSTWS